MPNEIAIVVIAGGSAVALRELVPSVSEAEMTQIGEHFSRSVGPCVCNPDMESDVNYVNETSI